MKEIVAEKTSGINWIWLVVIVVCVTCLILACTLFSGQTFIMLILVCAFGIMFIGSVFALIMALRTPKIIAEYDESGNLTFPEFSCKPRDLDRVEYKFGGSGRYRNSAPDYGTLYVYHHGKKYSYYYVNNLRKACSRLNELMDIDKAIMQVEQQEENNG